MDLIKILSEQYMKPELPELNVGDTVRIISGPLENFTGVVESINVEKSQVKVLVSMFGREISAELEYSQIQRIF